MSMRVLIKKRMRSNFGAMRKAHVARRERNDYVMRIRYLGGTVWRLTLLLYFSVVLAGFLWVNLDRSIGVHIGLLTHRSCAGLCINGVKFHITCSLQL